MLIGSGLQALATSGKFKPVALGQIRTAGNTLASAQLAPYKHARKTGQYIGKSLVLPEPTDARMAQEQIAMISRIAREGNITLEESTVLIGHLESYIRAAGIVELGPRIAALEAREAARAEQGGAHVGTRYREHSAAAAGLRKHDLSRHSGDRAHEPR
jgi:hypothetical protein